MDIRGYIISKKRLIDGALNRYLPISKTRPQAVHRAMRYAVFPGGKRIRPILTLASFEACGGRGNGVLPVACAIELMHSYTLIHDDLPCMDNDDYRRGRLSCHKKFSEAIALLAGDALLTFGFQLLSETKKTDIVREVAKAIGSRGTIGGQVFDVLKTNHELDYITSHKTGALFEVAVRAGGLSKGVGKKRLDALSKFGRRIGFTFQLIDDLIDKDGYVKVYGLSRTKKMAELLTRRAKGSLDIFGKRANRLSGIAEFILKRQS